MRRVVLAGGAFVVGGDGKAVVGSGGEAVVGCGGGAVVVGGMGSVTRDSSRCRNPTVGVSGTGRRFPRPNPRAVLLLWLNSFPVLINALD